MSKNLFLFFNIAPVILLALSKLLIHTIFIILTTNVTPYVIITLINYIGVSSLNEYFEIGSEKWKVTLRWSFKIGIAIGLAAGIIIILKYM